MLLDGVEGASLGSKFKHMKPGSKKKETIIKKQEPLQMKDVLMTKESNSKQNESEVSGM